MRSVVSICCAALVLAGCASSTAGSRSAPSSGPIVSRAAGPVPSGELHEYVLHDGDTVQASGEVVAEPGSAVRLCDPSVMSFDGPTFATCAGSSVRALGVDTDRLAHRETRGGAIQGDARLTGVYRSGTLTVTAQEAVDDEPTRPPDDSVPCRTPPGGWPRSGNDQPMMGGVNRYAAAHPGTIVEKAYLNPPPHRTLVYVLTTANPATVTAALQHTYGADLCVAASRYTAPQLAHARVALCALMTARVHSSDHLTAPSEACGIGLAPDEQVDTPLTVPVVDAQLAAVVDAQPAGLVQVDVWLRPLH